MTAKRTGKGKERPQHGPEVDELAALVKTKSPEELAKMREQAIGGLADLVPLAIRAVKRGLMDGAERRQGTLSADARYILDVILDRVSAPSEHPDGTEVDEDGEVVQTPVDQLAKRRAELQALLRAQRRDAEKEKRR